jgi:hypothetical protein
MKTTRTTKTKTTRTKTKTESRHTAQTRIWYTFWIDSRLSAGLKHIRERDGVLPSEQIRRALAVWLAERGLK